MITFFFVIRDTKSIINLVMTRSVVKTPRDTYRRNRRHLQKTEGSSFFYKLQDPVVPDEMVIPDSVPY